MQDNARPVGPELAGHPAGSIDIATGSDAVTRVGALAGLTTAPTDLFASLSISPTSVSFTV